MIFDEVGIEVAKYFSGLAVDDQDVQVIGEHSDSSVAQVKTRNSNRAALLSSGATLTNVATAPGGGSQDKSFTIGLGTPVALPAGWAVISETPVVEVEVAEASELLIGPGANLAGVDLTGQDPTGMDLTGAILNSVVLTSVNLTCTDLTNAKLIGANLTGVTWVNTSCPDGKVTNTGCTDCCEGQYKRSTKRDLRITSALGP